METHFVGKQTALISIAIFLQQTQMKDNQQFNMIFKLILIENITSVKECDIIAHHKTDLKRVAVFSSIIVSLLISWLNIVYFIFSFSNKK